MTKQPSINQSINHQQIIKYFYIDRNYSNKKMKKKKSITQKFISKCVYIAHQNKLPFSFRHFLGV